MKKIRVLLADDHPIIRAGVIRLLDCAEDIQVVGEASTGEEALALVQQMCPDVLLLDLELPDMKGTEVTRVLSQSGSPVKILVLTAYNNPKYIHELMKLGVAGYLLKEEAPQIIVEAVRGASQGEQGWLSRGIAANVMSMLHEDQGDDAIRLTPREMDVLQLVTEGKPNRAIGHRLEISEKTVEKYLFSIFEKLGVASRTEAAVLAVREGIVE